MKICRNIKILNQLSFNVRNERYFSSNITSHCLQYKRNGDPIDVVELKENIIIGNLKSDEVLVKMKSGVIHPSDINTIQGVYPVKPELPAIVGNEGYGEIVGIGSDHKFKIGDHVIPAYSNSGTLTTYKICKLSDIIKVPHVNNPIVGAVMAVNPCTAYRMVKDFVHLKKGDFIIQTGGTSAVGIYIIQLAKKWGIKTANIIRAREDEDKTNNVKKVLKDYGADLVFTEAEARTDMKGLGAKLAINCVGGRGLYPVFRGLSPGSTIVTYGGMNGQPLSIPVSGLIFSDFTFRGFWMTEWIRKVKGGSDEHLKMLQEIIGDFNDGTIRPSPYKLYSLRKEWSEAVRDSSFSGATPSDISRKSVLLLDEDE